MERKFYKQIFISHPLKEKNNMQYKSLTVGPIPWYYSNVVIFFIATLLFALLCLQIYIIEIKDNNVLPDPPKPDYNQCYILKYNERFDCFPEPISNQQLCEARGCCWDEPKKITENDQSVIGIPYCFYPLNYGGYNYTLSPQRQAYYQRTFKSPYPDDVTRLDISVVARTENCLNIRITPSFPLPSRYEPDFPIITEKVYKGETKIMADVSKNNLGFKILRNDLSTIFDTNVGGFIYADQFLQISSRLPANASLYGIGERRDNLKIDTNNWQKFVLFNVDQYPLENRNLYGTQPFLLAVEPSGASLGILLINSNAMEIVIQPLPAITFRTIGGIFNFYIFSGPNPANVIQQYQDIVGYPHLPPFWALGFHLCRLGTRTLDQTKEIFMRNIDAGIPLDVQWNDIDYMINNNDFTYNNDSFNGLPNFIHKLHSEGRKWVPIIDIGISGSEPNGTYLPFDLGIQMDVFIKNISGDLFIGKVWNRESTVWPDFSHEMALNYWKELLESMHSVLPFDGVWLDMNEPSNFLSGSTTGCPSNKLENPPYTPSVNGGKLYYKTLCMTAKHASGNHYDIHNVYGALEVLTTYHALSLMSSSRTFIITRASFSGIGHYAGHWSGDVFSTWHDLKRTISELLSFSLFGVPLMGADICGFNGNTTVELCARWYQLGAFYPFSRTHNTDDAIAQDPTALGEIVLQSAKKSLLTRYSLLTYLYTLFYHASQNGSTVARPLFIEFPNDANTYDIDEQFLWGSSLMIIPVLSEGAKNVTGYLPRGLWYDFYTGTIYHSVNGASYIFNASIDTIPLLVRGGKVILKQEPQTTSEFTRKQPFELLIALDSNDNAYGDIYYDDGISVDSKHTLCEIFVMSKRLVVNCKHYNYGIPNVNRITVFGKNNYPQQGVIINGRDAQFSYSSNKVLRIENINEELPNLNVIFV